MMVKHITKAENIISRRVRDEVVIISDNGGSLYILNKTAAFIWDLCDSHDEIDDIAAGLCERFEVTAEEAREDVNKIVKILTKNGIIKYN
jgi:hypothetical protein